MNIVEKIKALSAKEIILLMVEAIKNPVTVLDMDTFGVIEKGVCYGCAATNVICKLNSFNTDYLLKNNFGISTSHLFSDGEERVFIAAFEDAIDSLRLGSLNSYNYVAERIGIAEISYPPMVRFPSIENWFTQKEVDKYIWLAEIQDKP